MQKYNVEYENFDGKKTKETLYFNLSTIEVGSLQQKYGDIEKKIFELQKKGNFTGLMDIITDIILTAYGERSEDGRKFIKNSVVREGFDGSLPFNQLIDDLLADDKLSEKFMTELYKPSDKLVKKAAKVTKNA